MCMGGRLRVKCEHEESGCIHASHLVTPAREHVISRPHMEEVAHAGTKNTARKCTTLKLNLWLAAAEVYFALMNRQAMQ